MAVMLRNMATVTFLISTPMKRYSMIYVTLKDKIEDVCEK